MSDHNNELSLEDLLSKYPVQLGNAIDKFLSEQRLIHFIEAFWPFIEPGRRFVNAWVIEAICEHLEAVTSGEIKRLLINVSPGMMKSLTTNVFWPAWEWGPLDMPTLRYLCASYTQSLTVRDNGKFRNIITADLYRAMWGDRFGPAKDQFNIMTVGNNKLGWKMATSVGGATTGHRADRVILDDPNSVAEAESEAVRLTTNRWFMEVMPTRLNDMQRDAIVIIQQRTNEEDVSGVALANDLGYEHLCVPMRYEPGRHCVTSIGWQDPRGLDENGVLLTGADLEAHDGELCFPERFPEQVVRRMEKTIGEYATSGQLQQRPAPRGGGIFKRDWWQPYPPDDWPDGKTNADVPFPKWSYVVAGLDTALTEKEENDYSALTIWGVWHSRANPNIPPRVIMDPAGFLKMGDDDQPKAMIMWGWQKRLPLHGPPEYKPEHMSAAQWNSKLMLAERQKTWGLVEWVIWSCIHFKVDTLLIEDKAAGHTVHQELARLNANQSWIAQLVDPRNQDKVARAHSVAHLFSNGVIYAPRVWSTEEKIWMHPTWFDPIIDQMSTFPKGAHDDAVDSAVYALRHLRDTGVLLRRDEAEIAYDDLLRYRAQTKPLYDM